MEIIQQLSLAQITGIVAVVLVIIIVSMALIISHLKKKVSRILVEGNNKVASTKRSFEKEKALIIESHNTEINELRSDYEKSIKRIKEEIESRREVLESKPDKELLIDTIMALDIQSNRLARIEEFLNSTDTLKKYYNVITLAIQGLRDDIANVDRKIDSISSDISSIESGIDGIKDDIGDDYSYNTLSYNLSSLSDDVRSACEAAEEAKDAAESVRWAVEQMKYND